jgi:hypothetical protein
MHPLRPNKGCVIEALKEDPEGLSVAITDLINNGNPFPESVIDIDNIYILYGYQLQVCLSVKDEDIDDEVIDVCQKIADETEEVNTACRKEITKKFVNAYGVITKYGGDLDD